MPATSRTTEHVGEWQLELEADNLAEAFGEVAAIIADSIGPSSPAAPLWEHVEVTARDVPTLMADWANELLGRSEAAGRAYRLLRDVRIDEPASGIARISAEVAGEPVVSWRSPLKAATYHDLRLERRDGRWRGVLLFDV